MGKRCNFRSLWNILICKAMRIDEISKRMSIDEEEEKARNEDLECQFRDWGKEEESSKETQIE